MQVRAEPQVESGLLELFELSRIEEIGGFVSLMIVNDHHFAGDVREFRQDVEKRAHRAHPIR